MKRIFSLLLALGLTACATVHTERAAKVEIPVLTTFQGSLLVFSPKHRFQVQIQWQADLQQGHARLTHPASGRVVELRWQNKLLSMRDNQLNGQQWQTMTLEQLYDMGIVLPPWVLANILHRQIPKNLHSQGNNRWKGVLNHSVIQLHWQNNGHRLTMTDITHGRKAILRIDE